jgi:hypothetical protein
MMNPGLFLLWDINQYGNMEKIILKDYNETTFTANIPSQGNDKTLSNQNGEKKTISGFIRTGLNVLPLHNRNQVTQPASSRQCPEAACWPVWKQTYLLR